MNNLAKKRLSENFKQSVKYLTLVFNDFFILALIFLFGALMFWYAQSMKAMPANLWFYKPLVGFVMWLPLLTGKLVTLIKEADMQFLFTQDKHMDEYLKPMFRYSLILPYILIVLLAGILFPFASIKAGIKPGDYFIFVLTILIFKICQLLIEENNLYFEKRIDISVVNIILLVLTIVGVYWYWLALIVALISEIYLFQNQKNHQKKLFDWRYAVESEKARKDRVYSIFSMFTDVEEKQVSIKRRKYLDFLLPKSVAKENPNRFLYRRSLLRNPEYLNLLVRMTVFAVLISWLVQDWRWALGLSALVVFLTVYQLMPLATEFDTNIMYRVYPIKREDRGRDLIKVLNIALLIQWLIISVCWLLVLPIDIHLFESMAALLVFAILLIIIYLPNKVKNLNRKR